ncbi:MAG: PaaI family thioesterase [Planctomycetota bacterium]|nr:PaaI family thioesterase [Planctomycetota bacterium]
MNPTDPKHYKALEDMYLGAPCNELLKPSITIGRGHCEIEMAARPSMFHAGGAVHGSYYFKMLDDAAFFAAASMDTEQFVVTSSFDLHLMRPVVAGTLKAVGTLRKAGKALIIAEAVLFGEDGKELASGSGTFARSPIKLGPDLGYHHSS